MLSRYEWEHYITLTARFKTAPDHLLKQFSLFVRRLERITQLPVYSFAIVERGNVNQPHLHALLSNTAKLRSDQLRRCWKLGITEALRYQNSAGAVTERCGRDKAGYAICQAIGSTT